MIDSVGVEELDRSAETLLNTSGVTLNADLEPKTHHQTPMTVGYVCEGKQLGKKLHFYIRSVWQQCNIQ